MRGKNIRHSEQGAGSRRRNKRGHRVDDRTESISRGANRDGCRLTCGIAKPRAQMNRLINRLVSEATAPIGEMSMLLFKMAMLFFLAMSCLIASAIFLTIGFFEFLEPLEGYTDAAFGVGDLYLVAALICMLVIARERPASPR